MRALERLHGKRRYEQSNQTELSPVPSARWPAPCTVVCGRLPVIYYVIKYGRWRFVEVDTYYILGRVRARSLAVAPSAGHFIKLRCTARQREAIRLTCDYRGLSPSLSLPPVLPSQFAYLLTYGRLGDRQAV